MGRLHNELLQHFDELPDITVASATFEIVGFPPLKSDLGSPGTGERLLGDTHRVDRDA
jgi:hypothetical protein